MKRLITFLCVALSILSWATAVSAIPIAQGESFTWRFDTSSITPGDPFNSVAFHMDFSVDLFEAGEMLGIVWIDDIGETPLTSGGITSVGGGFETGFNIQMGLTSSTSTLWNADEDLYLTLRAVTGSVNVFPNPVLLFLRNNWPPGSTPVQVDLNVTGSPVSPVPEPTTLLLLGSGLVGLAGFRRKLKK